jgi:hypothetical protein
VTNPPADGHHPVGQAQREEDLDVAREDGDDALRRRRNAHAAVQGIDKRARPRACGPGDGLRQCHSCAGRQQQAQSFTPRHGLQHRELARIFHERCTGCVCDADLQAF